MKKLIEQPRQLAPVVSSLMTPVALVGYTLAFWRIAADLNFAGEFFITQGLLSRWQVWLVLAILTQVAARELNRFGQSRNSLV